MAFGTQLGLFSNFWFPTIKLEGTKVGAPVVAAIFQKVFSKMNQSEVVSELDKVEQAIIATKLSAPHDDQLSEDVYLISEEDKKVCNSLKDAFSNLNEVHKKFIAQGSDHFPFSTVGGRDGAKQVCVANLAVEMATAKFLRHICRSNKTSEGKPFDVPAMLDMITCVTWLAHINKLHGEHIEGLYAHLQQIIQNVPGRDEKMKELFSATVRCQKHNELAITRDMDGKKFLCKKCVDEIAQKK